MRVLLVEDDKELGDMIKKALSAEGYEVDWVQDGFLALKNRGCQLFRFMIV